MEESILKKLNGKNNDEISSALWVLLHTPGKSKYLKQIIPHLNNKVTDVRLPATMVIATIKDPKTLPYLEKLLEDNNEHIRIEAALALAKYKDIRCYQILKEIIEKDHKDHSFHKRAIEALGKFNDKDLLPIFKIGLFHRRKASRYKFSDNWEHLTGLGGSSNDNI